MRFKLLLVGLGFLFFFSTKAQLNESGLAFSLKGNPNQEFSKWKEDQKTSFHTFKIQTSPKEYNSLVIKYSDQEKIKSLVFSADYLFSITANYESIKSFNDNVHFAFRVGVGYSGESGSDLVFIAQPSLLLGRGKHYFETGIGVYQTFRYLPSFFPMLGYRYMGERGFILKTFYRAGVYTDPEWIDEWGKYEFWPGLQFGYRHILTPD